MSDKLEEFLISLIESELELKDEIFKHSGGIFIFHLEISGNIKSELHPLNILFFLSILILLFNFHFVISGINV